jgi:radical SAM/Cys-rich protein
VSPTTTFRQRVGETEPSALRAERVSTLLVNIGLRCDLACGHCHLSCSPEREETMSPQTMRRTVAFTAALEPDLVDVTGGAPELHPELVGFLTALREAGLAVRLRTNLMALGDRFDDLAPRLASLGVSLLASVPVRDAGDDPREDCWEQGVQVLRRLADEGYSSEPGLVLDLACTTDGAPTCQDVADLEATLRERLEPHGVAFRRLALLTCVPLGRYADRLGPQGVREYVHELADAFEPETLPHLGCRHGLEVAWDGTLWDCDFNLAAGVAPPPGFRTLDEADPGALADRPISFGPHCFACTARAGSS